MGSVSVARLRLEGKVALITGAASGIGKATARLFANHGAKVAIADIEREGALNLCNDLGPTASTFVHCDVTKELDVENAVDATVSRFGKLDIMFNNAGIVTEARTDIVDDPLSEFRRVVDVNLVGVFLGIKHAARAMIPGRGGGTIINTASVSSVVGGLAGHAYVSSKHGVLGLTKNAAVELGRHGIRVNCVSPYVVATPLAMEFYKMSEEGCHGMYSNLKGASLGVQDVAEAALYLASDESKYVSGHNLVVDGGFSVVNAKFCIFDRD